MNRGNPIARDWAERLIAYEASLTASESSTAATPPLFPVAEKLRPHFAPLMGDFGFRALLSRALALAAAEVPWLRAVRLNDTGAFEGLGEPGAQLDPEEFAEGRVVLLSQLLALLLAFIGEGLTLRLVGNGWPDLSFENLDLGAGVNNEQTE